MDTTVVALIFVALLLLLFLFARPSRRSGWVSSPPDVGVGAGQQDDDDDGDGDGDGGE